MLEVLDALNSQKSLLVGTSCAGQVLTVFAGQHSDRLRGLVYLDGATDPTLVPYKIRRCQTPQCCRAGSSRMFPLDNTSFEALRSPSAATAGFAFQKPKCGSSTPPIPTARWGRRCCRPGFVRAITVDARIRPDYTRIRTPVLAMYQAQGPFEDVAARYVIRTDQERAALRRMYDATRALYTLVAAANCAPQCRRHASSTCRAPTSTCS